MRSSSDRLLGERERRFHRQPGLEIRTEQQAARFVDEVGLCVLFPVQRIELPSLWEAINGSRRPVPQHHDDEGLGKAWRWKDTLPSRGRVYYGKLLHGKATLLALELLPFFYALSPNYGGEADYLQEYEAGRLSREARAICDVLLACGWLPTGDLRRQAHLSLRSQKYRFERAMVELQQNLMVAKVGIADAGPWHYSYVYDLFARAYPEQVEAARYLTPRRARQAILRRYVQTAVVANTTYAAWLFGWRQDETERAGNALIEAGDLVLTTVAGWEGEYLVDGVQLSEAGPAPPA